MRGLEAGDDVAGVNACRACESSNEDSIERRNGSIVDIPDAAQVTQTASSAAPTNFGRSERQPLRVALRLGRLVVKLEVPRCPFRALMRKWHASDRRES